MISYSTYESKIPRTPQSREAEKRQSPSPHHTPSNDDDAAKTAATRVVTPPTADPPAEAPATETSAPAPASSIPSYLTDLYPIKPDKSQQEQDQQEQQERQDQQESDGAPAIPASTSNVEQQQQQSQQAPLQIPTKPVSSSDMSTLLKHVERREWMQVVKFFERFPQAPRQKAQGSGNLPLHEALKHSPPLPVVNLLLEMHEGALRTPGAHGYLPLHVACNCRHIGVDVVTRLVVGHAAALRHREPTKDCLPLHMAVQTGVSEDVLMELLTNYPEASFVQDNSGKIPMDYAQESVHNHNRSIVALEMAPILLAAAQAAQSRVSRELEFKMNGLRDAHKEYVRQLEERFEEERTEFMQDQIQFSNDLAHEKERNISLAELLLEVKTSEKRLRKQRDQLQKQLDKEMKEFRTMIETQDAELRLVLDEAEIPEGEDEKNSGTTDRALPGEQSTKDISLKGKLQNLTKGFNETKAETVTLKAELVKQKDMVRHLNELLTAKDEELVQLKQNLVRVEAKYEATSEKADELTELHDTAASDLARTKEELNELKLISHENQNMMEKYKQTIRVQGSRLGTVKTMVSSLNFNLESWEEEDRKQEDQVTPRKQTEADDTFCHSTLGDEVDTSHDSDMMAGTTVYLRQLDDDGEEVESSNTDKPEGSEESKEQTEKESHETSKEAKGKKGGEVSSLSESTSVDTDDDVVVAAASAEDVAAKEARNDDPAEGKVEV
ncbi:MAG: hypothetical protein SGILL_005976 [Bacillariaceae sp.]